MRPKIIASLIGVVISLLVFEGSLRAIDPMGISYLADIGGVFSAAQPDGAIYTLPAGKYHFRTFDMTILDDHTRRVPDTPLKAACIIVAIGDSGTMGHGVNDSETWVNLLARQFPDVRFVNTGLNGYSSREIMFMQQRWADRADGFLYRIDPNDIDRQQPPLNRGGMFSYTSAYLLYALAIGKFAEADYNQLPYSFFAEMQLIDSIAPTLFFSSDPGLTEALLPSVDVRLIPDYTYRNSPADPHPNSAGHEQLANAMLPDVTEAIARWCQ